MRLVVTRATGKLLLVACGGRSCRGELPTPSKEDAMGFALVCVLACFAFLGLLLCLFCYAHVYLVLRPCFSPVGYISERPPP